MKLQYVSFYDHEINTKENRVFSPAGRDITAYVAGALTRASINVEIISLACTDSKNFHYKGKTYETPEGFKVTLPPTLGGYGKFMKFIRNIWTVLLPYLYLFPRIKSGSTILVYHSVSLVIPVRILQLLKRVKVILQVEEIYADVTNNESYRRLESLAFKKAHAFIFPTVSLQNMINTTAKPSVILHGCYTQKPIIKEKYKDGKTHCVYAGTFDLIKGGVMNAISSAEYLNEDFVIHIIGFGSEREIQQVKLEIKKMRTRSKCEVVYDGLKIGRDFEEYIQQCHIGLSTQNPDGQYNATSFPSKVLMYLSHGLKVVSVDLKILRESGIGNYIEYVNEPSGKGIADAIKSAMRRSGLHQASLLNKLDREFCEKITSMIGEVENEN